MSVFALFFLLLLGFFLWPLIKIAFKVYQFKSRINRAYRQAAAGAASGREASGRAAQQRADSRRGKRIGSDVGTYVDFEEVAVDSAAETARQYRQVDYVRQQQVSDAEWEEIR